MSLDRILRAIKLDSGATVTKIDATATLAANSDSIVPTQKAVKTYVDTAVAGGVTGPKGKLVFPMSFETGEQTTIRVYFPMKVTINKIRTEVTKALAATDAGTVTCGNSSGASTSGVCTHAASAALANRQVASPSTNNVVLADGYYYLTTAKTTVGGKVLVGLEYTLTA
jgi:hypothetical protein